MARAILTKKLYRVVEMRDGKPHGIRFRAGATNYSSKRQALKAWNKAKREYPGLDVQLLETEPLVWSNNPDPHPVHDWTDWVERTKYNFTPVRGKTSTQQLYWRQCVECDEEEWVDLPPELIRRAAEGCQEIESDLS